MTPDQLRARAARRHARRRHPGRLCGDCIGRAATAWWMHLVVWGRPSWDDTDLLPRMGRALNRGAK